MRRLLTILCAAFVSTGSLTGQQIRTAPVEYEDFVSVLKAAGYEIYNFDLKEFLDMPGRYEMLLRIKQYESGKEPFMLLQFPLGPNKLYVRDYPRSYREEKIAREGLSDPETMPVSKAEKLSVGFYPSVVDSIRGASIEIPGMRGINYSFRMRKVLEPQLNKMIYYYQVRPFKIETFEAGKDIPLLVFLSGWTDGKNNCIHLCGETEIDPDLSSEILQRSPHYYVISIVFTEKQEPQNTKNN